MCRVELKAYLRAYVSPEFSLIVPNVPCGVESVFRPLFGKLEVVFLFLMCRVELKVLNSSIKYLRSMSFLMCRVELKVPSETPIRSRREWVPNVPCGVERSELSFTYFEGTLFLMCRVELKVETCIWYRGSPSSFLMCRVELKVLVSVRAMINNTNWTAETSGREM